MVVVVVVHHHWLIKIDSIVTCYICCHKRNGREIAFSIKAGNSCFTARLQCPVIEADKMESLVLRTELLYGHLLRIHEGNIAPAIGDRECIGNCSLPG